MSDCESYKVSVVIPVYNPGRALFFSAASVLGQSHRNLELILVDDGSTDGSSEMCHQIAAGDDRVVVFHQPNGGVSSARNTGIAHATGDYLTFVDADDLLAPGALSTVVRRLAETGADLACFGMTFAYHDGSRVIRESVLAVAQDILLESPAEMREVFFELFSANYLSSVCNKVYRTAFVCDNQIQFNGQMAILEDFEFVVSSLAFAPRVLVLAESLYRYHIDLTQRSSSRRPSIDYLRNFRRLEESLERFSAVVGFASPEDLGQLDAMLFRFYLIGLEMLFARRMAPWQRLICLKRYMSDIHVVRSAQEATRMRRGVSIMAKLVSRQHVFAVFAILLARKWTRRSQQWFQIAASGGLPGNGGGEFARLNHRDEG